MKFKVGDRVVVTTTRHDDHGTSTQFECRGTIYSLQPKYYGDALNINIEYDRPWDGNSTNCYSEDDLEHESFYKTALWKALK